MENLENEVVCKFCNDEGYIYTCFNCHKPAIYDSEFGIVVCDTCFILGEEQDTHSEKCTHCDIADRVFDILKVGDVIDLPSEEKINQVINWLYLLKITHGDSYEILKPIEVDSGVLKYFSYVENEIKNISLSLLQNAIVVNRRLSIISWTTTLKGLKGYLKEERNKDLVNNSVYVRLLYSPGCSWDMGIANLNDVINKINIKESYFSNGLTFKIEDLLNNNLAFKNTQIKIINEDNYFFNKENNHIYFIESIKKFEIF
jgi:hypothetical protein